MYHVFRTLASCRNKENWDVFELKIEESEKAVRRQHRESNTGHLACSQYNNRTTISPHNSLYGLFTSLYFSFKNKTNKTGRQNRQTGRQNRQTGRRTGREGNNVAHGTVIHSLLWTHIISLYMSILKVRQTWFIVSHQPFACRQAVIIHIRY